MRNKPMYSFIIEEVSTVKKGHILNQAIIFAHDEDDAHRRHHSMYPDTGKDVEFHVYPHVQVVVHNALHAPASVYGDTEDWEGLDSE